ncbi:NADH:flavin oxidoreductase/NADH oxidase [Magnetococcus marinus MC-1]|uniref:NADH:flavin oxidoreductase/NADH oxidase n=1 Tax=Magnetococcus marinus (strain ATCC BAA-1437 / JCM 17883 / MC-1) TaxID=156889 RepID=A0L5Q2_MAGMM|nr:alkene reductase [Magnetococcus marinus]ABK43295.1 NADH:flavin oxidoreductase/NADH oxidase [Magnetococcus marinus MC-1]
MNHLFKPLRIGDLELPNRLLMAPLTRCRADAQHVPTAMMVDYYAQRASAGLLITEATMVMQGYSAFWREPGIYSDAQIEGWKKITQAVHAKGGRIFMQIWHGGRACHPLLNDGREAVAPSPLAIAHDEVHTPQGKQPYTLPRALRDDELPAIVNGFARAARHARAAGFDGVEVHGANGYLLDQFLRDGSNHRSGAYGGSVENRARLLLEVIEAVSLAWGSERVGLRISPLNSFNDMIDSDPMGLAEWLAKRLNAYPLAYLHLMRRDFLGQQQGDVVPLVRQHYKGTLIGNMGYGGEEAEAAIAAGQLDGVAFGSAYLANPDLPERLRCGAPLNTPDPTTFYTQGAEGYTDYPTLAQG